MVSNQSSAGDASFRTSGGHRIRPDLRDRAFGFLSLFTSFGTLICCALPSLLVLLGLGATVASFLSAAPWLVTLSQHKGWVFAGAGALIALNFGYVYVAAPRLRGDQACPVDEPTACGTADRVSRAVLWISAAIYALGFFAAYLLGPILVWWEP
jgi:mercuric ion transport protein